MKPPLFRQALPGSAIVLIVDDEPSTREASSYMLRTAGYVVLEASSGPEALEERRAAVQDRYSPDDIIMTGRMLAEILSTRLSVWI